LSVDSPKQYEIVHPVKDNEDPYFTFISLAYVLCLYITLIDIKPHIDLPVRNKHIHASH